MPTQRGNTKSGGDWSLPVLLAALAALGVFAIFQIKQDLEMDGQRSRWPTVEGRVLSSVISESSWNDDGYPTRMDVEVSFAYEVVGLGQTLSARQRLHESCSLTCLRAEAELERQYFPGVSVLVYYNPSSPSEAVVQPRTLDVAQLLAAMTLGLIGLGAAIIAVTLVLDRVKSRKAGPVPPGS